MGAFVDVIRLCTLADAADGLFDFHYQGTKTEGNDLSSRLRTDTTLSFNEPVTVWQRRMHGTFTIIHSAKTVSRRRGALVPERVEAFTMILVSDCLLIFENSELQSV